MKNFPLEVREDGVWRVYAEYPSYYRAESVGRNQFRFNFHIPRVKPSTTIRRRKTKTKQQIILDTL